MCEDFVSNFGDRRIGCCIRQRNVSLFTKNNITVVSPPYRCLFRRLKIQLKGSHFYTIEVMEAESQAVLNTLTEQTFKMNF
jgi:hypothetical protein